MTTRTYTEPPTNIGEMLVPRKRIVLSIPLAPRLHAEVDVPNPMTEEHWQQMMAVLEAMKPGLVRDEPGTPVS